MLHFGTHKSYDDDDEDDDIYGIDDDWQETDDEQTNLQKQNMMYKAPNGNWFITLLNKKNDKETFINFSQIVSVNFEQEKDTRNQDPKILSFGCTKQWLIIATSVGVYRCKMELHDWQIYARYFKENSFRALYERPILCSNIEFKSN